MKNFYLYQLKRTLPMATLFASMALAVPSTFASPSSMASKAFAKATGKVVTKTVTKRMAPVAVKTSFNKASNWSVKPTFNAAAARAKITQPTSRAFNIKAYGGWPKNDGFLTKNRAVLQPGAKVSRIGGDSGRFVSKPGTSVSQRALPRGSERLRRTEYTVVKPIANWHGRTAPAFGMKGGATQHQLPLSIRELVDSGHLKPIRPSFPKSVPAPAPAPKLR